VIYDCLKYQDMGIGIIEWSDDSLVGDSAVFNPLSVQPYASLPIDMLDLGGGREARGGMVRSPSNTPV
jgi:hypothetical protein